MSGKSLLEVKPQLEGASVKLFKLLDLQPSSFVKKGTEGTSAEQRLNAPSIFRYPSESTVVIDGQMKKIRYVAGAETILLEEQIARGIQFRPTEDVIIFKHGDLAVANDAENATLFTYMSVTTGNIKSSIRVKQYPTAFTEIIPSEVSASLLKNEEQAHRATAYVYALYTEKGGKKTYEENKILMLCNVFGVRAASFDDKILGLLTKAKANPEAFMTVLENSQGNVLVDIRNAVQLNLLSMDGDKASIVSSGYAFHAFEAKKKADRENELVDFFLSDKGTEIYAKLKEEFNAVKENMAANT